MGWHSRGRAPTAPSPCTMSGDELRGGYFTSTRISPVRANPRGFSSLLAGAWGVTRGATAPSRRSRERVPLHAGERRPDLRSGVMLRGRKPPRPGRSCPPGGQPCAFAPPLRWPWRRSRVRARRPRAVAYATVCSTPCCSSTPPPVLVSAACDIGRTAARGVIVGVVLPSCDASLPGSPAAVTLATPWQRRRDPLGHKGFSRRSKRQVLRMPAPSPGHFAPVRCRRSQNYRTPSRTRASPSGCYWLWDAPLHTDRD